MSQADKLHKLFSHICGLKAIQSKMKEHNDRLSKIVSMRDLTARFMTPETLRSMEESGMYFGEQINIIQKISPELASDLQPILDDYEHVRKVLEDMLVKMFDANADGKRPINRINDVAEQAAEMSGYYDMLLLYTAHMYNCLMDTVYFLGHADEIKEYEASMGKGPEDGTKPRPHPKSRMPEIDWLHHLVTIIKDLRAMESEASAHDDMISRMKSNTNMDIRAMTSKTIMVINKSRMLLKEQLDAVHKISPVTTSDLYDVMDGYEDAQKTFEGKLVEVSKLGNDISINALDGVDEHVYRMAAYHDELATAIKQAYRCYVGTVNFLGHGSKLA